MPQLSVSAAEVPLASRRIAVVDDDPGQLAAVSTALIAEGFVVDTYRDGQAAMEAFGAAQPDLALVDVVMPGLDGMELLQQIRARWSFPVLMLSSRDDEVDELLSLRIGADDFLRKPVSMRLLMERVRVGLRRGGGANEPAAPACPLPADARILERGALRMDAHRHSVTWKGREVTLTATEFLLLEALAQHPGYVKSRDQLMDAAYDDQVYVDDRTIDSHIKRLRKKLRAVDPAFSAIETLYGIGYRYADLSA